MKFFYLSDTHIRGKNPENRIGNYYQDVMTKIREVINLARTSYPIDYIIHGGDIFNSPYISNIIIDEFVDLIESINIQMFCIYGNHDEIGHNKNLSQSSALAHIFRRAENIFPLDTLEDNTAIIKGYDYYHNIEEDIKINNILNIESKKLKIVVPHAFLTPKPFLPHVMHVELKDIKTNYDIVLCSHYHCDWGIKEINGTKYINLGAIGRQGIDEINRTPKILYIDTEINKIEIIELKSAKPGKEVFNIEKIDKMKSYEKNIDNFVNSLSSIKMQSLDIRGKIEEIAKEKKIDKNIVDTVITRIGQYEEDK